MVQNLTILALALLALASKGSAADTWLSDNIAKRNAAFEFAASDSEEDSRLNKSAQDFLKATGGPAKGLNTVGFRLWAEGAFTAFVASMETIELHEEETLVVSGYGGNGATAFPLAKDRAKTNGLVTMVLLPFADGSRGNNGIIKGIQNTNYDAMETDLREWSQANGQKIKFITIMDESDTNDAEASTVFSAAAAEKGKVDALIKAKEDALVTAMLNNSEDPEKNEEYLKANEALASSNLEYYTVDRAPKGELHETIQKILIAKLDTLRSKNFTKCYEGHSGQGFNTKNGTTFSYPMLDFLIELKELGTIMVSLDYPLGMTETGFQTEHRQYIPNVMIVIFVRKCVFKRNAEKEFALKGVTIIELDWNTMVKYLFDQATIAANRLIYSSAPSSLVEAERTIQNTSFGYRKLLEFPEVGEENEWNEFFLSSIC